MYHDLNPSVIETDDLMGIEEMNVIHDQDGTPRLQVTFLLNPGKQITEVEALHVTNGVNPRLLRRLGSGNANAAMTDPSNDVTQPQGVGSNGDNAILNGQNQYTTGRTAASYNAPGQPAQPVNGQQDQQPIQNQGIMQQQQAGQDQNQMGGQDMQQQNQDQSQAQPDQATQEQNNQGQQSQDPTQQQQAQTDPNHALAGDDFVNRSQPVNARNDIVQQGDGLDHKPNEYDTSSTTPPPTTENPVQLQHIALQNEQQGQQAQENQGEQSQNSTTGE